MPVDEGPFAALAERALRIPPHSQVLLASTSSDSHTWNLVFLQLLIAEHGHEVRNLGPCVPVDVLVGESLRVRPALLVLSSVNGHGIHDARRAIHAVRRTPALDGVSAVIGGKLTTNGVLSAAEKRALLDAGFDAVFTGKAAVERFRRVLTPVVALARAA